MKKQATLSPEEIKMLNEICSYDLERVILEKINKDGKFLSKKDKHVFIWDNNYLAFRWYYNSWLGRLLAWRKGKYFGAWDVGLDKVIDTIDKVETPDYKRIRRTHNLNTDKNGRSFAHEFCSYCEPEVDFKNHDYFKLRKLAEKINAGK